MARELKKAVIFNAGSLKATTVKGQLSSRRLEQVFLVGAQAGQELYLQVKARTSDGLDFAILQIYDSFGKPLGTTQENITIRLTQTGDYRIRGFSTGFLLPRECKRLQADAVHSVCEGSIESAVSWAGRRALGIQFNLVGVNADVETQ